MLSICLEARAKSRKQLEGLKIRIALKGKQITLNFKNMKTIETPGIDYMMIAMIVLYIVMHFIYGLL
jgi:hypothetical protein